MQVLIKNLTFGYPSMGKNLFENVSFSFDTKFKIGVIGRNGRGKTTLMKILLNKQEFKNEIISPVTFDYFPYKIEDKNKLSIDIVNEIYPEYELWKILIKMKQLELNEQILYQTFSTLSSGEQTKLLLSVLFTKENNFLLIDEPTNHLDISARDCVKNFLNNQTGFMVVSHDRSFLDGCVNHILSINKSNIVLQRGNFSSFMQNKENEDNLNKSKNQKLKNDIKRLETSIENTKKWGDIIEKSKNGTKVSGVKVDKGHVGHMAAKMMKRAKSIEKRQTRMLEEKKGLLNNLDISEDLFLNSNSLSTKATLVEFKDVCIYYEDKQITNNINFIVHEGDKIALLGKNGSGKTSILKLLLGENIKYTGNIYKNNRLKVSYISQTYNHLSGTLIDFCKEHKLDNKKFFTLLFKLGLTESEIYNNIENFSDGQKKKIILSKALCEEANIYVFDEPLNYIDLISRMQIETLIKESNITLIFVEHDKSFVENVATQIINLG